MLSFGGKSPIQSPHPCLLSIRDSAIFTILWQQKEGRGTGTRRGIPPHCGDIPPQGPPQGERRNYIEVTEMARLERGFTRSTRWLHIPTLFFVKFSRGSHLFFMWAALIRVRCNDNDSFSAYHHIFYSVPVCCTPRWGAGCSICWGQRTYAMWQTMLAGYFLDTGGITT